MIKEYEIHQDGMMVAGSSGKNALVDALHYCAVYGQDGPLELFEVTRVQVGTDGVALAASGGNSGAELPEPFFYYESDADGAVKWNEGCVCQDDVYTNAEYAAESGTHGGKVYSEAQMIAYGKACAAASAPNAALVAALKACKECLWMMDMESSDSYQAAVAALSAAGQEVGK